jgi:virginiamycin B lyase
MRARNLSPLLSAAVICFASASGFAQTTALTGQVSSAQDGAMEGVLITVRKDGSSISTTVVSDAKGHYAFPTGRLEPGRYGLKIRAFGYALDGPVVIDVTASGSDADIELKETADLAPQMTNSEWLMSAPGTPQEKRDFSACATCHGLDLAIMSQATRDEAKNLIVRMANFSNQAFPKLIQQRVVPRDPRMFGDVDRLANYIASINLSSSPEFKFRLKGFERPKGKATRVIITSYELPRETMQPHDTVMGDDGYVWVGNFGENDLSRLDPKTGQVKIYPYAQQRPGPYANGNLDLEFDRDGYIWLGLMNQTGIAKFDRKTEKFNFYPIPADMLDQQTQTAMVAPTGSHIDGKIWIQAVLQPQITRFDKATGKYEPWRFPFQSIPGFHAMYGVYADSQNNAYYNDFPSHYIWRIDAKTGAVKSFRTPTEMSRPRRGRMDDQDRLWFAEWWVDKVGMFDTKSGEFREWEIPGYMPAPYDAELDKNGWVWTNNMMDDLVTRLDPETGEAIQYLMPIPTNGRRVAVDNYGDRPVLWVGANLEATVMKVEPLE